MRHSMAPKRALRPLANERQMRRLALAAQVFDLDDLRLARAAIRMHDRKHGRAA